MYVLYVVVFLKSFLFSNVLLVFSPIFPLFYEWMCKFWTLRDSANAGNVFWWWDDDDGETLLWRWIVVVTFWIAYSWLCRTCSELFCLLIEFFFECVFVASQFATYVRFQCLSIVIILILNQRRLRITSSRRMMKSWNPLF